LRSTAHTEASMVCSELSNCFKNCMNEELPVT